MFDYIFDLITHAISNTLFVFCLCNFLILVLLAASKPALGSEQESEASLSTDSTGNVHSARKSVMTAYYEKNVSMDSSEVPAVERVLRVVHEEEVYENENESQREAEEEEEDELRRRVEEFIEKVNKRWRAERLNASILVSS